jgi:site-specific DNA-methyltransferase (adenine-specific)
MSRRPTETSAFGSGRRESHDASRFYRRFPQPEISSEDRVAPPTVLDRLFIGDAREMTDDQVADNSVALLVTSPPYFTGKEYESEIADGDVAAAYFDYLEGIAEVLRVCARKLEPGGRMAINVANLGRRPYRSLSADLISILQDQLGLLLRGEIVWRKAHGAGGSCAWGSFRSPANPVLRDLTERVIIASKGRFDRAIHRSQRSALGLPSLPTISANDFMEATLDLWDIPAESATRVGHPAPFPVELPRRLIELYTTPNDLILDPYIGSGTTAVAAAQCDRHFVGFDTEPAYIELASRRVDQLSSASPRT